MKERKQESRLKKRIMERMAGEATEPQSLDERDEAAIGKFAAAVSDLIVLLQEENVALEKGEVQKIEPLFQRKQDIYGRLQIHEPIVEPILKSRTHDLPELRESLAELQRLVNANGIMIERISAATSAVAREVKRIQRRHSLDGLYEKSGRKVGDPTSSRRRFDEKM